jgi:AraC-like DNA-binding protein
MTVPAGRRQLARRVRRYVGAHLPDPDLSLAEVALAVGISSRQLQRVFREEFGEPFRDHLLRERMERAMKLISRQPPLSLRDVAPKVGYSGPSGLRQAFLRYHGRNPSEFHPPRPPVPGIDVEPSITSGAAHSEGALPE